MPGVRAVAGGRHPQAGRPRPGGGRVVAYGGRGGGVVSRQGEDLDPLGNGDGGGV